MIFKPLNMAFGALKLCFLALILYAGYAFYSNLSKAEKTQLHSNVTHVAHKIPKQIKKITIGEPKSSNFMEGTSRAFSFASENMQTGFKTLAGHALQGLGYAILPILLFFLAHRFFFKTT